MEVERVLLFKNNFFSIFKEKKAYNKMLKINNLCKLSVNNFIGGGESHTFLFAIDGTLIINKSGIENIGIWVR